MAFDLYFLRAALPLTKTIELINGQIVKKAYPLVLNFTSEVVSINTIDDFFQALMKRATSAQKPCLIKGLLSRPLVNESRKATTSTNSPTRWVCLDIDDAPFSSPEEVMRALSLTDVSYVVQYSSSYKLGRSKNLSCHIFFLLSKAVPAPELKAWLMHLNLSITVFERAICLSNSNSALHWPLDITTCQNDKLIYTAMPVFKGMPPPLKETERIALVKKDKPLLDVSRIVLHPVEALKKQARDKLNQLRVAAGLTQLRGKTRMVNEYEVQHGVGEVSKYETIDCDDYVRLNLNGGDSQAYWHYKGDTQYLHNFKGEPSYLLKEILPSYYAELVRNAKTADQSPTTDGSVVLAFRDKVTATYYKGAWHPKEHELELYTVKSELQLDHYLQSVGRALGPFIPEWRLIFDPQNPVVVDEAQRVINTFVPTEYMRAGKKNAKGEYPIIQRVLDSAVGVGEIQEHFLNWLAVVWQQRRKPLTAWVLHGTEGTGKGVLFHNVIRPLFGYKYAVQKRATELGSQFNGWLEQSLVVFVDEIDADMFVNTKAVEADLRTMITEPTQPIRRMRTDSYEVQNFTAFIFSSNKRRPVALPEGDRRFNIGAFQHVKLVLSLAEVEAIEDELPAFANYLSTRKADFHLAKSVLQTSERAAIQKLSVTSASLLASELLHGRLIALWEAMPDESLMHETGMVNPNAMAYASLVRRWSMEPISKITRDELSVIFRHCVGDDIPDRAHKQAAFLRHHGIEMKRLRFGRQFIAGIEVKWQVTPEDQAVIDEELNRFKVPANKMKRVK